MALRTGDISLQTAILTSAFCALAAALYQLAQVEPSPCVETFLWNAPGVAVLVWFDKDARRSRVQNVYDWAFLLLMAWPVLIPWYTLKTRGRKGWLLMLGMLALMLVPLLVGPVVGLLVYGLDWRPLYSP